MSSGAERHCAPAPAPPVIEASSSWPLATAASPLHQQQGALSDPGWQPRGAAAAGDAEAAARAARFARAAERAVSWRVLPVLLLVVMVSFIDRTKWVAELRVLGRWPQRALAGALVMPPLGRDILYRDIP
jgi:hypothetical protein